MKIYCNAGHHLEDQGAVQGNLKESFVAMKIRDAVKVHLPNIFYIPDGYDLTKSIEFVNETAQADDFGFSIHLNRHNNEYARGVEVFYDDDFQTAQSFAYFLSKKLLFPNRGARHMSESYLKNLAWLREPKCPTVLVEVGFMSNCIEREFLASPEGQQKAGLYIAQVVKKYEKSRTLAKRFNMDADGLFSFLVKY